MKFKSNIGVQAGIEDNNDLTGNSGQILSSTGSGVSWIDQGDITIGEAETAKSLQVTVKNVSGGELTKGTVVHTAPTASPPSGNVIEVIAADYDDTAKMPAVGILKETIVDGAEGEAVMTGTLSGIATDGFSIGDELYVGADGALTNVKPQTAGQLIQKIAVCVKSHASNGLIKIFGAGRSNDVPLPLYIDNTNQRLGIGTATPGVKLEVDTNSNFAGAAQFGNSTGNRLYILNDDGGNRIQLDAISSGGASNLIFANGGSESMRVNSSGHVGIGTTSPSSKLNVSSASFNDHITLTRSSDELGITVSGGQLMLEGGASPFNDNNEDLGRSDKHWREAFVYSLRSGGVLQFKTNGNNERMRITSTGNVGIGETDPQAKLHINRTTLGEYFRGGSGGLRELRFSTYNTASDHAGHKIDASSGNGEITLATGGSARVTVDNTGNVGIGTTDPGQKTTIVTSNESLHDVLGVYNGVTGTSALGKGAAIRIGKSIDGSYSTKIATIYEGNNPSYLQPALAFFTMNNTHLKGSEVERMRISANGNVGIGTDSPSSKLSVRNNGAQLSLQRADDLGTEWKFYSWTFGLNIFPTSASEIYIGRDGATTNLQLHNGILKVLGTGDSYFTGNVGIGTTSPSEKLNVSGNILATGTILGSNLSGTNTGDQDLSVYYTKTESDDRFVNVTGDTMTGTLNMGSSDLVFEGTDPGDMVWKNGDGNEVHRIWSGTNDYLTYRNDSGTAYALLHAGIIGNYLPTDFVSAANGGTFGNALAINHSAFTGLTLNRSNANGSSIDFNNSEGLLGRIGYLSNGSLAVTNGTIGTSNMMLLTSGGNATFAGDISANNLSGTNTGDQDLSGYLLNTTDDFTGTLTLTGNYENIKAISINGTNGTGQEFYLRTHGTNSTTLALYADTTRLVNYSTSGVSVNGDISADNLSGTNTGDQDLSGYALIDHNHDSDYFKILRGSISLTGSNPFDDSKTETRVTGSGSYLIGYTGASAHLISSNVGGSASMFQIGAHYNGSDFYMRTRTDSSTWQTWKKLWHSGNLDTSDFATSSHNHNGTYLPLTAGSGSPLTGDLYIEGADKALRINNGAQPVVYLGDGGANTDGQLILYNSSGDANIVLNGDNQNHYIVNGNVGIGTTSPTRKLSVVDGDIDIKGGANSRLFLNIDTNYLYGDTNGVVMLLANDNVRFRTQNVERMRIDSNGNVGIGVVPADRNVLDIRSDDTNGVFVTHRNNDGFFLNRTYADYNNDGNTVEYQERIGVDGNRSSIGNFSNHTLGIRTNNQDRITVLAGGNVGIGTTSPSERLEIVGNIKLSGTQYVSKSSSANITPNAGDWIDIAYMPYGEHHGLIALEWNGISAPSCCHHGWAQFSVGTYYSSSFNYGQDTYVELVKAHAHNDFWLEAVRAVDVGSTVRIQVKFSRTVVSGSFVSYVLSKGQGTITPYQPYVNNNSYTVLANANVGKIDGEEVQKAFANPVRFSGKTSFDDNVGIGTTDPYSLFQVGHTEQTTAAELTIASRYGSSAPILNFRSGHANNDNVWNMARIVATDDGNYNGRLEFRTTVNSGYDGTQPQTRMVIKASGNVGINETSPEAKLEVGGNIAASDQVSVNNRTAISVAHWSGQTATTGAIKISLPGTHTGNWSMIVLRITTYEYNSNNHTVYYVSGHDWTSGWYNNGVTKIGDSDKDISLAYDSNKDYVIVGETTSSWAYGHVTVDVMAHPSFYSNSMDIRSGWGISQDTDLTGITIQAVNNRKVLTSADAYYTESESDSRFVNVSGDTMTGDLTLNGNFYLNPSSTEVTMSGNTSGNFTIDNNTGQIAFQANGSTVNSMTITSSQITLNEISQVNNVLRTLTGMGDTTQWDSADLRLETTDTINTTGFQGLRFATSTSNNYGWRVGANRRDSGRGSLRFYEHTGAATGFERFTIAEDGNVGIGATSPGDKLQVAGNAIIQDYAYIGDGVQHWGDGGTGMNFPANDTIDLATSSTSRIRIDSSGNVGIGTTSPGSKLEVTGDAYVTSEFSQGVSNSNKIYNYGSEFRTNGASIQIVFGRDGNSIGSGAIGADATNCFAVWNTDSTSKRMVISQSGNVGIGTDSPSQKLEVNGNIRLGNSPLLLWGSNNLTLKTASSSTIGVFSLAPNSDGTVYAPRFQMLNASEVVGVSIRTDGNSYFNGGNVGIGTTSPDLKLDVSTGYNNGIRIAGSESSTFLNLSIRAYVTEAQANALPEHTHIFTTNPSGHTSTAFQRYGGTVIQCRNNGNTGFAIRMGDGTNWHVPFYINNNRAITCSSTVTATNFILSSDETLKENIKDLDVKVDAKWRSYKFKDSEETRYGVIAQELEETNPELVRTNDEGLKSVAYVDLLIAKIAELEARLEKAGL